MKARHFRHDAGEESTGSFGRLGSLRMTSHFLLRVFCLPMANLSAPPSQFPDNSAVSLRTFPVTVPQPFQP